MTTEKLILYPHQDACINALDNALKKGEKKGLLVCMPCGAGKTLTMVTFLKEQEKKLTQGQKLKVLWVVSSLELVKQTAEVFVKAGFNATEYSGESKDDSGDVIVTSVQSVHQLEGKFDWLVFDESHDDSTITAMEGLDESRLEFKHSVGLSATPERTDDTPTRFTNLVHQSSYEDLRDAGLLNPMNIKMYTVGGGVIGQMQRLAQELVSSLLGHTPTIVYAPDIVTAKVAMNVLSSITAADSAFALRLLTAKSTREERDEALALVNNYREGTHPIPVLFNVDLLTQGVDLPKVSRVEILSAGTSEIALIQRVGRATRTSPNKPNSLVTVGFGKIEEYVTAISLLRKHYGDESLNVDSGTVQQKINRYNRCLITVRDRRQLAAVPKASMPKSVSKHKAYGSEAAWVMRKYSGVASYLNTFSNKEKTLWLKADQALAFSIISNASAGTVTSDSTAWWRMLGQSENLSLTDWRALWEIARCYAMGRLSVNGAVSLFIPPSVITMPDPMLASFKQRYEELKEEENVWGTPDVLVNVTDSANYLPKWVRKGHEFSHATYSDYSFILHTSAKGFKDLHPVLWSKLKELSRNEFDGIPIRIKFAST